MGHALRRVDGWPSPYGGTVPGQLWLRSCEDVELVALSCIFERQAPRRLRRPVCIRSVDSVLHLAPCAGLHLIYAALQHVVPCCSTVHRSTSAPQHAAPRGNMFHPVSSALHLARRFGLRRFEFGWVCLFPPGPRVLPLVFP